MITIGSVTWTDHPLFTDDPHNPQKKSTLVRYAQHLPTVEVDMPFYRLPTVAMIKKWQKQVPKNFQFILKANRIMTKHDYRKPVNDAQRRQTFREYAAMMSPLAATHQLKTILLEFPPYFQRDPQSITYLKLVRQLLPHLPLTIEFRNPSWYRDRAIATRVAKLLAGLQMTEAIVDEPHNANDGIPFVPTITNHKLVFLRLHGRNTYGWFHQGKTWRKTRTLYKYSDVELQHLATLVQNLAQDAQEVCVIFNNNSGKDAAPNAMKLKRLLHLKYGQSQPQQLGLF